MCTLTLAWQVFDDTPVAVAANRDEAVDRASSPPDVYRHEPLVVAPRDDDAGGTWIGYNECGVFAGITNRWTDADLAAERSRGLLVADVLAADSADAAATLLEGATAAAEYDGFYLVIADANAAYCYGWDGDLERVAFDPGVHVVVNAAVDDAVDAPSSRADLAREQAANARAVRDELSVDPAAEDEPEAGKGESAVEWLERAGDVLGDHEYGVCIHRDGFGTRSSSLIALGHDRTLDAYAPGPPCKTTHEPIDLPPETASAIGLETALDLDPNV